MGNGLALVCSVGTTYEPVRYAIQRAAEEGAREVLLLYGRELRQRPTPFEVAARIREYAEGMKCSVRVQEIPSPQDFRATLESIMPSLEALAGTTQRLVLDITGGTKVMSAALAFAGLRLSGPEVEIQYIGGEERNEVGRVVGEMAVHLLPVWRARYEEVLRSFQQARYEAAYALAESLPDEGRASALKSIALTCRDWDNFAYLEAQGRLTSLKRRLEPLSDDPELADLVRMVRRLATHAEAIRPAIRLLDSLEKARGLRPSEVVDDLSRGLRAIAADTLANAQRRLAEGRPTDAVLRAYRAVEVAAQCALVSGGINPWNVQWEVLPARVVEPLRGSSSIAEMPRGVPLGLGVKILALVQGHSEDFLQDYLREIQQVRNFSFLEHGYSTVDQSVAERQVEGALSLIIKVLSTVQLAENFDDLVSGMRFSDDEVSPR